MRPFNRVGSEYTGVDGILRALNDIHTSHKRLWQQRRLLQKQRDAATAALARVVAVIATLPGYGDYGPDYVELWNEHMALLGRVRAAIKGDSSDGG